MTFEEIFNQKSNWLENEFFIMCTFTSLPYEKNNKNSTSELGKKAWNREFIADFACNLSKMSFAHALTCKCHVRINKTRILFIIFVLSKTRKF
jgi:hypothetical protein